MRTSAVHRLFFLLLFICGAAALHAQIGSNQWKFSNPKPFGFWGWQMAYADDQTALLVGEYGGIARTTDGGGTWQYFAYTTTNGSGELIRPGFNDVQFVNNNLAFIVGDNGVMIKSTDGGINWSPVSTPFSAVVNTEYNKIHTVCFLNATTGYIGGDGDSATNRATIYKTTDGGATWQPEFLFPAPAQSYFMASVLKIRFSASGVGYVGGANGLLWKYENGVWSDYTITDATVYPNVNPTDTALVQWGPEPTDTITVVSTYADNTWGLDDQNYRAIAIMNDTAVVVGTQNNGGLIRINTATAAGSYWLINNGSALNPKYAPLNSPQIYNAKCRDGNTVVATSSEGKVLRSDDKGFTWVAQAVYTPGTDESFNGFFGIDISPSGRLGVCGSAGVIADSLTQWRRPYTLVQPQGSLSLVQFVDAANGIAAGSSGAMMRTTNGGERWEDISNPTFNPWEYFTGLCYLTPQVLIASASNAQLYKSLDGGTTFDLLYLQPEGASIDAIDFINEDTGWMIANVRYPDNVNYVDTFHQFIYRTVDGGFTWDTSSTVLPYDIGWSERKQLKAIKFLNATTGFAVGDSGAVYKTTDGGVNWVKQTVPGYAATKTLTSIAIVDANTLYISGERNFWINEGAMVMKTTNGGSSWTMCNNGLPPTASYPKILMYNASEGLLFGFAVVYVTKDGGASWTPYYTNIGGFPADFYGASFAPIPGCSSGVCQKVFAVAGRNILKLASEVVLPVKFSRLTGSRTAQGNQLFWTEFSQEVVSWFEVERSTDGTRFISTGEKIYPGTAGYQNYNWLDRQAPAGRNFYRIRAVERTGAVYFTNVIVITNQRAAQWMQQQSFGHLILSNTEVQRGKIVITLLNGSGQVMASRSFDHPGGAFNQLLPLPVSAKGLYYIRIEGSASSTSLRFFKE